MAYGSISREISIEATPEVVYDVISRPEHLREWWPDEAELATSTPGSTGTVRFGHGPQAEVEVLTVVEADPPRRFAFRWVADDGETAGPGNSLLVTFELVPAGNGTLLRFTETGFRERGWQAATLEEAYQDHVHGHVLVLTTYDTEADITRATEAGATGYLLEAERPEELFGAIHSAAQGRPALSAPVAIRVMAGLRTPRVSLTGRERDILAQLARGLGNRDHRPGPVHRRGHGQDPPAPDLRQTRGGQPRGRRSRREGTAPAAVNEPPTTARAGKSSGRARTDAHETAVMCGLLWHSRCMFEGVREVGCPIGPTNQEMP